MLRGSKSQAQSQPGSGCQDFRLVAQDTHHGDFRDPTSRPDLAQGMIGAQLERKTAWCALRLLL